MQAYELYLKAREMFIARRELPESVRLFERVVELDPKFARGWEGSRRCARVMRAGAYATATTRRWPAGRGERALELDPSLSMPWAALAMTEKHDLAGRLGRQFSSKFDRAIAADPRNSTACCGGASPGSISASSIVPWPTWTVASRSSPATRTASAGKGAGIAVRRRRDEALELYEQGVAEGFVFSRAENFVARCWRAGRPLAARLLMDEMGAIAAGERDILVAALQHHGTAVGSEPQAESSSVLSEPRLAVRRGATGA